MKKIIPIMIGILIVVTGIFFTVRTLLFPVKYQSDIKNISSEYNIDPYVLAAIGHFESRFDDKKYEKNSNNGILRFSDDSSITLAEELDIKGFEPNDLTDEKTSLKLGAYYLSKFNSTNLSEIVQNWAIRNGEEKGFDKKAYAKKYYVPKIEKNMKILKVLYPGLKK